MTFATWLFVASTAAITVPPENIEKGELPKMDAAESMVRLVLEAIVADSPRTAEQAFFPLQAFEVLKDIARPHEYHAKLLEWFDADIHREHARVRSKGPLVFESFQRGGCVWKAKASEANKIPYWSCYRNRFHAKTAQGEKVTFELKAMINWGSAWYVTHLGPTPK